MSEREDDSLAELLTEYLQRTEAGESVDVQALCADCPELLPALEEAIGFLPESTQVDPWVDRVLRDRYRVERRIGAGGMGLVFLAHDQKLGREVAIKVLESVWADDEVRRARFEREARALAAFRDPGVVAVHDLGLDEQPPFLVMEFVPGLDVSRLIERVHDACGASPPGGGGSFLQALREIGLGKRAREALSRSRSWPEMVARLGAEMARIVSVAHDAGILHRDLKPSNFMLDGEGRVRLLDFGLARDQRDEGLTRDGVAPGSPRYLAPELVRGEDPTPSSEIHALGATLYELLCLRPTFEGTGRELEHRILYESPPAPHELVPRLPRDLSAIVARCLRKQPQRRYETMHALRAELERFLAYEPVLARNSRVPLALRRAAGRYRRHAPPPLAQLGIAFGAAALVFAGSHLLGAEWVSAKENRDRELQELRRRLSPTSGLERTRALRASDPMRDRQGADLRRWLELAPEDTGARFLALQFARDGEDETSADRHRAWLISSIGVETVARWEQAFTQLQTRHEHPRGSAGAARDALKTLGHEKLPPVLDLRMRGLALLEQGRFADLRRLLTAHESGSPETACTLFLEGVRLAALDRERSRTLRLLERVHELCPSHLPTIHNLARQLRRLGRAEEALAVLRPALQRDGDHLPTLELESLILRTLGAWQRLETRLAAWPPAHREHADLQRANALLRRANLRSDQAASRQRLDEARELLLQLGGSSSARLRRAASRNLTLCDSLAAPETKEALDVLLLRALEDPSDALLGDHVAFQLRLHPPTARQSRLLSGLLHAQQLTRQESGDVDRLMRTITAIEADVPERALDFVLRFAPSGATPAELRLATRSALDRLDERDRARWQERLARAGIDTGTRPGPPVNKENDE